MPTWTPAENTLIGQAWNDTSTTTKHKVGTIVRMKDLSYGAGEFIYMKGVASCEQYDWVTLNADDGTVTRLVANAVGPVGIAQAAITASYYGWFQISGKAIGQCLTQFADNAKVWITATAGAVDDASVAGDLVINAKGASLTTVDSGVADFEISRPWVNDRQSGS